jgi:hypothetical protein
VADFYVAFGEGGRRSWDDAVRYGFVSAGGGRWYSRTLHRLTPDDRAFVYIPRRSGVGGYVGVAEVVAAAVPVRGFLVEHDGRTIPILDAPHDAPRMGEGSDDPDLSEYLVAVRWLATRSRRAAVWVPGLYANENSATRLTHGFTLATLVEAFGIGAGAPAA